MLDPYPLFSVCSDVCYVDQRMRVNDVASAAVLRSIRVEVAVWPRVSGPAHGFVQTGVFPTPERVLLARSCPTLSALPPALSRLPPAQAGGLGRPRGRQGSGAI